MKTKLLVTGFTLGLLMVSGGVQASGAFAFLRTNSQSDVTVNVLPTAQSGFCSWLGGQYPINTQNQQNVYIDNDCSFNVTYLDNNGNTQNCSNGQNVIPNFTVNVNRAPNNSLSCAVQVGSSHLKK